MNAQSAEAVEQEAPTSERSGKWWEYVTRINSLCRDSGIKYSYENTKNGFKFIIYRPVIQSDNPSVTLDVTLNGTEMSVLAILKQKPDSSREEIANRISKTVRTIQRALNSLGEKGYIVRIGSKQIPKWRVLK